MFSSLVIYDNNEINHWSFCPFQQTNVVGVCFNGHPLNFKVSRDKKIGDFDPNWAFPDCNFSLNLLTVLKWWIKLGSIKEVSYWFFLFRLAIKFQGHAGWKITDLNLIWVRFLCRSQLSNPSDLPCYWFLYIYIYTFSLQPIMYCCFFIYIERNFND